MSNAYPPTVCFLLADIWSIGAVMLLRPTLTRRLQRPHPWKATIFLNGVIMTLFLWHMTAYFVVLLALWPLRVRHQQDSTAAWWWLRPVFIGLSTLVLAGIVALVGRFERPAAHSRNVSPNAPSSFGPPDADSYRETRELGRGHRIGAQSARRGGGGARRPGAHVGAGGGHVGTGHRDQAVVGRRPGAGVNGTGGSVSVTAT